MPAITFGLASGSLSLVGFGLDAAIDSAASMALVWRFRIERLDPERADRVEHAAERIVGGVLVVAALLLTLGAARALLTHGGAHTSAAHLVLLVVSLVVLPPLALAKRRVAVRLGSIALRNDALLRARPRSWRSSALLATVLAETAGLWWADALGTLIIAAVLAPRGLGERRLVALELKRRSPGRWPGLRIDRTVVYGYRPRICMASATRLTASRYAAVRM